MKGIIIDGVASSGKSSILKLIQEKIVADKPNSTKLFVSEHYTQRMLEHLSEAKKLSGKVVGNHFDNLINSILVYQNMLNHSKFADNPRNAQSFITLERFILTHYASDPKIQKDYQISKARKHYKLLSQVGIKQVVLVVPKKYLKERITSTLSHRNNEWKKHLQEIGSTEKIVNEHLEWQKRIISFSKKFNSSIYTKTILVKDLDFQKYADIIYKLMLK